MVTKKPVKPAVAPRAVAPSEEKKKNIQPMVVKKTIQPVVDRHMTDLKNLLTRESAHIDKEIERLQGRKNYLESELKKMK